MTADIKRIIGQEISLFNIEDKNKSNNIPTLIHNNEQFESNDEKAKLFCSLLKQTFSNNGRFDESFKLKIELEEKKNINLKQAPLNLPFLNTPQKYNLETYQDVRVESTGA
jgi:hypothetical protein